MVLRSQNGWEAGNTALIKSYKVPGTNVTLRLREGYAAIVLLWWAVYWDKYVEPISTQHGVSGFSVPDDWGYADRDVRGSTTVISNHASGTAEDLNATRHPRGVSVSRTLSRAQIAAVHLGIKLSKNVMRWGGDYVIAPPDGMHGELNAGSAAVAAFAKKIQAGKIKGSWPGFPLALPPVEEDDDMNKRVSASGSAKVNRPIQANKFYYVELDQAAEDPDKLFTTSAPTPTFIYGPAWADVQSFATISGLAPGTKCVLQLLTVSTKKDKTGVYPVTKRLPSAPFFAGPDGVAVCYIATNAVTVGANTKLRAQVSIVSPGLAGTFPLSGQGVFALYKKV